MKSPPAAMISPARISTIQNVALPKPIAGMREMPTNAPSIVIEPCAKLTTRSAPKTSVRPAETRNSTAPVPRPAMICTTYWLNEYPSVIRWS